MSINARHHGKIFLNIRLRDDEGFAVGVIEAYGNIPGDFQVLLLVLAYRHLFSAVKQDISSHQHGIGKQAVAGGNSLGSFIFVGVASFKETYSRYVGEQPGQFRYFRNI